MAKKATVNKRLTAARSGKTAPKALPPRPATPEGFLGQLAIDKLTGFKGTVDSVVYMLSGCVQAHVQPMLGKDGKMESGWFLDLDRIDLIGMGPMAPVAPDNTEFIALGITAIDKVTAVEGTLTEKQIHINGCTTFVMMFRGEKTKGERAIALDWKRLDLKRSEVVVPAPQPASAVPPKGGAMRQSLV